ncbi:uncharacterized protein K444DRAFT_663687 [Hyaloscypha bicolor E]|uniref:Uncharacterized protein n=1 Tax=Hyaloscypha bicolor E TaxID=1095630 RepID=A0A2J6T9A6_9HELO|nr:uncharacterized protein K444DRAFT_663687 [Hyaloscypha bicolor E]PMD59609.1 hypothetical protein K444DRAFT_663687 [Hyaloscypha bicolor E]
MRPFHISVSFSIGLLGTATVQFDYHSGQYLFGSYFGISLTNAAYDYVVVGGGTAGLVVASRLAENPNMTIAVQSKPDPDLLNENCQRGRIHGLIGNYLRFLSRTSPTESYTILRESNRVGALPGFN